MNAKIRYIDNIGFGPTKSIGECEVIGELVEESPFEIFIDGVKTEFKFKRQKDGSRQEIKTRKTEGIFKVSKNFIISSKFEKVAYGKKSIN